METEITKIWTWVGVKQNPKFEPLGTPSVNWGARAPDWWSVKTPISNEALWLESMILEGGGTQKCHSFYKWPLISRNFLPRSLSLFSKRGFWICCFFSAELYVLKEKYIPTSCEWPSLSHSWAKPWELGVDCFACLGNMAGPHLMALLQSTGGAIRLSYALQPQEGKEHRR